MSPASKTEISTALEQIRQRLLDLTLRNRLLNYRPRAMSVAITDELPSELLDRLVTRSLKMALRPLQEEQTASTILPTNANKPPEKHHVDRFLQTTVSEARFHRIIRRLGSEARRAIDETGTNILYLAVGMLSWRDAADEQMHQAPLLLIPLEVIRKRSSKGAEYRVAWTQEEIERNISLAKLLSDRYGIELPALPEEEPFCIEQWLRSVSDAVGQGTTGDWEVRREAVIDLFSFARLFMFLDLDPTSWPESHSPLDHPIINRLLFGGDGDFSIQTDRYPPSAQDRVDEMPLVFDADSAQTTAILEAADGKNLVIEGPPGTGKSQTISNLISLFLHDGKSVLFLSEKLAALEVVHQRLSRADLTPFLLELHGNKLHRPTFIASLKERVELKYRKPRGLRSPIEQYRQTRRRLDEWASAIGSPADASGTSIHDAFWLFESTRMKLNNAGFDFPTLPNAADWNIEELTQRREVCDAIGRTLQGQIPADSPWHGFWPRRISPTDRESVANMLDAIAEALDMLTQSASAFTDIGALSARPSLQQASSLANVSAMTLHALSPQENEQLAKGLSSRLARQDASILLERIEQAQELNAEVSVNLPNLSRQTDDGLADLLVLLQQANNEGWHSLRLHEIEAVHARIKTMASSLEELEVAHDRIHNLGLPAPRIFAEVTALLTTLSFWRNETPPDLSLYLGKNLFQPATLVVFRQAEADAAQVRSLRAKAEKIAWLESRPDLQMIQSLIATYLEYGESFTKFLFPRWRAAKRQVRVLLKDPPEEPAQIIAQLRQVAEYLTEASALNNNEKYAQSLGLLFQGESTSWEDAQRILNWGREAADKSSAELLLQIVQTFDQTKEQLRNLFSDVSKLQKSLQAHSSSLDMLAKGHRTRFLPELTHDAVIHELKETAKRQIDNLTPIIESGKGASKSAQVLSEVTNFAQKEKQARDAIASATAASDRCQELFGKAFNGAKTKTSVIRLVMTTMDALVSEGLPEETLCWLSQDLPIRHPELTVRIESIRNTWAQVVSSSQICAEIARVDPLLLGGTDGSLQAASTNVRNRLKKIDELIAWSSWSQLREEAIELGMEPYVKRLETGKENTAKARTVFEWSRAGSLINCAFDRYPILQGITGERRAVLADRFTELEAALVSWNVHRVRSACAKRKVPAGVSRGNVRDRTELALIRREISKSRSYLPVRQLLSRAGKAMQALKPCFMMSPLAVSRFLPHELAFDVLIVDEASQLRPEDCLGAIGRCRQIVVVGDPKQLPPTSFFDRLMETDTPGSDQETAFDDVESILDVVGANLAGGRRLLWHYRSRHQDLIRFSNKHFYDGSLTAFPTPRPRVPDRGVGLRHLPEARYASGSNLIEAQAVAAEAAQLILGDCPGSIGIAAFNSRQRDLIEDCLESLAADNPTLMGKLDVRAAGNEPLFIKNLENVQGDERDVMLLSFTYGPDAETGKVYQRFGPINSVGGWRRLNVLFTRARERILVFSSMRPDQIRIDADSNRGVRALRGYLEFAAAPEAHQAERGAKNDETLFSSVLGDTLREAGFQSDGNVGEVGCAIDLAVRDPEVDGAYCLGVESDGEEFYSNPVARERERIRPQVLKNLGWNLHVIHAPDWFRNREDLTNRLLQAADDATGSE